MDSWYQYLVVSCAILEGCFGTFVLDFQSNGELSTDEWAEYNNNIPAMAEFTSCFWEKLRYFATDYTAVWGYCSQKSVNNDGMKCTQFYHRGNPLTANRHINVYGWIDGRFEVTVEIPGYLHRTWNHFCWKYSSFSGNNTFYYNGEVMGVVIIEERPIIGSNENLPDALIIGQEQDSIKGRYELSQMFNGEISELNIWSQSLDDETIKSIAKCKNNAQGNVVSWNKAKYSTNNVKLVDGIDPKMFCKKDPKYVIFPRVETLENSKKLCAIHGGRIAAPTSVEENNATLQILNKYGSQCMNMKSTRQKGRAIWLGFVRMDDKWYITDDGDVLKEADYGNWDRFTPIYPGLGCTFFQTDGYWSFRDKASCSELELCTICAFDKVPVFSLKGPLCKSFTPFDWNYYFSTNNSYQIDGYIGYKEASISRNSDVWTAEMEGVRIELQNRAYPIGRQNWSWYNRRCSSEFSQHKLISLSKCEFGDEFTCRSGRCIPIIQRCDQTYDCKDRSDEEDCVLVRIPDNYNKIQAPKNEETPLKIVTQITILNVDMIDTVTMLVGITLEIKMKWNDNRLTFANLNRDRKNPVSEEIVQKLWLPLDNIIHENAVIGKVHPDDIRRIFVVPNTDPMLLEGYETYEELLYSGAENSLEVSQRFRIEYDCVFNLEKFPFDRQKCDFILKMMLSHNNSKSLVEDDIAVIYNGESKIDQFYIGQMIANTTNTGLESRLIVSIELDRIYNDQMINTFIPTFLLWMLGYSTLFINIKDFNDRFMGTVTALLVLASLLSSINMTLPRTSYFKYIDLWFLWYLANIFAIILYHIILDFENKFGDVSPGPSNNVSSTIPIKLKIGEKIKVHGMEKLSNTFDEVFGGSRVMESPWEKKNRLNRRAIIFFPTIVLFFNIGYFICTT